MDTKLLNKDNDNIEIREMIIMLRYTQVIIDRDLAKLYGVATKVMNQAVKRNIKRFPPDFRFQLNDEEKKKLVTNCDPFKKLVHSSSNPYAFTEQGIAMLSTTLRSDTAIEMSIDIMKAFVDMRKFLLTNAGLLQRLEKVEIKQIKAENQIEELFRALNKNNPPKKQGVFYDGEIFDAYNFLSDLVRNAHKSIVIIDNYIDDTVLKIISKNKKNLEITILTNNISKQCRLDINKYNQQYHKVNLIIMKKAHDRFLIIDQKEVYHFGASLKDLGKKWFAFSKIENDSLSLIAKVNQYLEHDTKEDH